MDKRSALVDEFAECVAAQSRAVLMGNAEASYGYARRYVTAFLVLRKLGDEGRDALATLLDDERADVRAMAACCLLRHCGERARRVLEAEANEHGLAAFSAAETLHRWEEGRWDLDPATD
jgi:hypothetical protein